MHTDHGWEVDSFFRPPRVAQKGHVWLDPHILATPAIADIDGDGQEELVVAVSYFFDSDQYSRPVGHSLKHSSTPPPTPPPPSQWGHHHEFSSIMTLSCDSLRHTLALWTMQHNSDTTQRDTRHTTQLQVLCKIRHCMVFAGRCAALCSAWLLCYCRWHPVAACGSTALPIASVLVSETTKLRPHALASAMQGNLSSEITHHICATLPQCFIMSRYWLSTEMVAGSGQELTEGH